MNANYKPKVNPYSVGFLRHMSDKEARAWALTEPYRKREYDAYSYAVELSVLYMLALEFGFGKIRLRRAWKQLIRNRVLVRHELRYKNYTLKDTGRNVEDTYMEQELLRRGVNLKEWLDTVIFNVDKNEVRFTDEQ